MISVGRFTFFETNVAFHYMRESVWHPWETIGVYVTSNSFAGCYYQRRFKHIEGQFDLEVRDAVHGSIYGSVDFLDMWRDDHKDPTSVISPIINYCTAVNDSRDLMTRLYTLYVCDNSAKTFAKMAVMLKKREMYFPCSLTPKSVNTEVKQALREADLI